MSYSIKSIKEEFKAKGIFYTPPELGELLKSDVDIESNEVYDPSCGHGNLLELFGNKVKKYGQDINEVAIDYAKGQLVNADIRHGDTIADDKFKG